MKILIVILLLLANLGATGYLLAVVEGLKIELIYNTAIIEKGGKDLDLLKKILLYDDKKAKKILFKQWFPNVKQYLKGRKIK